MFTRSFTRATPAALLAFVVTATLPAPSAMASGPVDGSAHGYDVYADVVDVTPRYRWRDVSEPVRRCEVVDAYRAPRWHRERGYRRADRGYRDGGAEAAAGLVGGLVGGLIGHQFGGGDGRTALTVTGALLGSSIARERVRRDAGYSMEYGGPWQASDGGHTVRRCFESERTRSVRSVEGYDVAYRYHGTTFHKRVNEPPGEAIRVHVSVEALD